MQTRSPTRLVWRQLLAIIVALIASLTTPVLVNAQVQRSIINASFEDPQIALGCQGYVYAARVSGWFTTDAPLTSPTADFDNPNGCVGNNGTNPPGGTRVFEYYSNTVIDNQSNLRLMAADGVQFVELNAQTASRLYQNVCLVAGETVSFSFSHLGRRSGTTRDVARFVVGGSGLNSGTQIVRVGDTNTNSGGVVAGTSLSTNTVRTTGPSAGATGRNWGNYSGSFVVPATLGGLQQLAFEAVSSASGSTAQGNFLDNIQIQIKPTIQFASGTFAVSEAATGQQYVQVSVAGIVPAGGIPVSMTITPGTATIGTDYTINGGASLSFTSTIPAGNYGTGTSVNLPIPLSLVNDRVLEGTESFSVTLSAGAQFTLSSTTSCNAAGQATATFNITDNDGTIRIIKDAVPNDAQDFAFTTTGADLTGFSLDDDADPTLPNSRDFVLNAGSYSVTEDLIGGWRLGNILCTDPDNGSTVTLASRLATIDLDAGELVVCTFTNNKLVPMVATKTSAAYWDPVNGFTNPKMIPGAIVNYTITVSNPGTLPITADSIFAIDALPNLVSMIVGDFGAAGSGPISFSPGASTLTYAFAGLASLTDNIDFSSDGGANWTMTPSPGANNADASVTHFRITPKGAMAPGSTFSFIFRALIK